MCAPVITLLLAQNTFGIGWCCIDTEGCSASTVAAFECPVYYARDFSSHIEQIIASHCPELDLSGRIRLLICMIYDLAHVAGCGAYFV